MFQSFLNLQNLHFIDYIDIALVLFLIFQVYKLIKGTAAVNIFIGIIAIYITYLIVDWLNLKLLSGIFKAFLSVGVIALIIVFQQEVRHFLLMLGKPKFITKNTKFNFLGSNSYNQISGQDVVEIVNACKNMSQSMTGALIVIAKKTVLTPYIETGEILESRITTKLIESIFYKNSTLHDGAIIISDAKIMSAKSVLPITENPNFPSQLGLRHKSAAGVTENSDSIAIIVSEQTGFISIAKEGKIELNISPFKLKQVLRNEFNA